MKTFYLLMLIILSLISTSIFSAEDFLTIGCTTKCSLFYRTALKNTAKQHELKIKIIDLSKMNKIDWKTIDGILIPGGADIDPKYYLDKVDAELAEYTKKLDSLVKYTEEGRKRDPIEYGILKEYFERADLKNIPILGICRGMQMLAVSQGIPLYVDIKTELGIRNRRYLLDRITVDESKSSLMNDLFEHSFLGFKQHHQGIRVAYFNKHIERWPNLFISAYSNKGVLSVNTCDKAVIT